MAPPSSPQEDKFIPEIPSGMGSSENLFDASNLGKRSRESFEESFDDVMWDSTDDGRPKTRRVNPQRLAIRLGPDLVAEMEAYIVPGAKMPTFAVRKDFQERYAVDRRHIYDYFHSRGLRVAKEDKHTNLIRGRALKAKAQLQATSKPATTHMKLETTVVKLESPPCETLPTFPSFLNASAPTSNPPDQTAQKQIEVQDRKPRLMCRSTGPSFEASSFLPESDILVPQASCGETSSEPDAGNVTSPSGTDTDWESAVPFSLPCDTSDDNAESNSPVSDFLPSPDNFIVGYFDSPMQIQQPFLEVESSAVDLDSYITLDEHRLLTEDERTELYNLINNNISNALEESAGTYNNYMNERSRSHFDRLIPVSRHAQPWKRGPTINKTSTSDSPTSVDLPDLRKWLSDELDLCQPAAMPTRDYSPIRDTFGAMSSLDGFGPTGGAYHTGLLHLHSQNRSSLGNADNFVTHVSKKKIQGF